MQQEEAEQYFESELSPALTPLVIDPVHPFPFLSNLSTSLVFRLRDVARQESMFARVKVPGTLKQWVSLEADVKPGQKLFVPLYEIIRGNLHKLYSGMKISQHTLVRLTRDAEVEDRRRSRDRLSGRGQGTDSPAPLRTGGAPGILRRAQIRRSARCCAQRFELSPSTFTTCRKS